MAGKCPPKTNVSAHFPATNIPAHQSETRTSNYAADDGNSLDHGVLPFSETDEGPANKTAVQYAFDGIICHASRAVAVAGPPTENNFTPTLSGREG
jgi:hypothetical protein